MTGWNVSLNALDSNISTGPHCWGQVSPTTPGVPERASFLSQWQLPRRILPYPPLAGQGFTYLWKFPEQIPTRLDTSRGGR
jgi:hypothetical protein